ncbi:LysR family transcriptional regulator [Pseudomaricurvus alkylphenolicus]|uniref:LysR family transcriptional regulator n=1 Tax=Pseudomaricurvus alkylphenolicus TaxID=1306991 RepID=UPI00142473E3|nr:LysR family transcriptional regulator [Pseudomaricurvus alkylphenolicus]NIB38748.1 LysR family transcriptional regulator [Pseudomaricurvus alkylphenolicus]
MKEFDTSLDARQLKLFLSLADTLSLTKTAEALGVGQSTVSHALNRLRKELGDPLFVRSGRSIKATHHALSIVGRVREVMTLMEGLVPVAEFDPATASGEIVIGANEYQRDRLLPDFLRILRLQAPDLRLRIVSNPFDPLELLRDETIDLVLAPTPPEKGEIHNIELMRDFYAIFYDSSAREAPRAASDFLEADYVIPDILHDPVTGYIRRFLSPVKGHDIKAKVVVNSISGVPQFLKGTNMLAPLPEKLTLMSGFSSCRVPGTSHPFYIHLCWHQRNHGSPKHQWMIQLLQEIAQG